MKGGRGSKAVRASKAAASAKSGRALKAARAMERKVAVCAKLREVATPLDYSELTVDEAYKLGIVAPGLVPNVSSRTFFASSILQ
jgi:hypothetical protein